MDYDVIVAGASFAGLAVATGIKGKVLLIDRKEVGSMPTSACATTVKVLNETSTMDSLCQVLPQVMFFTGGSKTKFKAAYPFCTFDYGRFCQILYSRYEGDFLLGQVKAVDNHKVITDQGEFSAKCLVDCTGWRATLASSLRAGFIDRRELGFAIETECEGYKDYALQFFIDPPIINQGLAWIFPAGEGCRFGLGSYTGKTDLIPKLKEFLARYGLEAENVHGGYLPNGLRAATVENLFLVGDSAGQVLPVLGEGIRQALFFGRKAAAIIQRIVDREIRLDTGLAEYKAIVERYRPIYDFLSNMQEWLVKVPNQKVSRLARILGPNIMARFLQARYAKLMPLKKDW